MTDTDSFVNQKIDELLKRYNGQKYYVKCSLMRWWGDADEAQLDRLLAARPDTVKQETPTY